MKRRELLAGLGSVGILGGGALIATGGPPGVLSTSDSQPEPIESVTLTTVDAPGSRDGEVTVPADGRPTFVDFFGTWCPPCIEQMPALAAAEQRVSDDVLFVSVTTEDVGGALSEESLADWWRENDGDWLVAGDVTAELAAKLNVGGYPTAVVLDANRRIQWSESGTHTADTLVSKIDSVLDR